MYEKLAELIHVIVDRWTSKSPKTAKTVTDVALYIGIGALIVASLPVTYPAWVLPATAFTIALTAKFTKAK